MILISGSKGVNGQDPPIPENSTIALSFWDSLDYIYNKTMNETVSDADAGENIIFSGVAVFGRNGTKPTRGGHGGVGGLGGYAGKIFIAGLGNTPNFTVFNETGNIIHNFQH